MRHIFLLALSLCACEEERTMLPISPGGGGTGGSTTPDAAAPGDGDGDGSGRVCLLSDPRRPTTCASSGAGGLTVTLGSAHATTGDDGTFTLERPPGTNLTWIVSGAGIEPSAMRTTHGATIPALASLLYGDMVAGMNATIGVETGAIIAQLRRNNAAVAGAVAIAAPTPLSEIYYDGPGITAWEFDATGSFGVVWISSIDAGNASLGVTSGMTQTSVTGIPVFAGAITFVFAEIP